MSNILFTFIFGGLMVSMAAFIALLTSELIKRDMKKTFDFIIKDKKTGAEMYDKMMDAILNKEDQE